jgi:hypothetical protein
MMNILRKMDYEDLKISTRRVGRYVIVKTERPSIARSVLRKIEEILLPEKEVVNNAIGFQMEEL